MRRAQRRRTRARALRYLHFNRLLPSLINHAARWPVRSRCIFRRDLFTREQITPPYDLGRLARVACVLWTPFFFLFRRSFPEISTLTVDTVLQQLLICYSTFYTFMPHCFMPRRETTPFK